MMKNNKNKQSLVVLWTYECVWIDVEVDSQSQTKLEGLQMRMELKVCQRVKCQYMQNDKYKLVEHREGYLRYQEPEMINIRILRKWIYTNNIRSSQAISSRWNKKERYMLEKNNITRYIKFLSCWIKTTIPFFTFTVTKKESNNRSRGQFIAFCMGQRTKQVQPKTLKEE